MSGFPIPGAALDDRLAFIGTSGSGKTYNAGSAVEILLAHQAKVVVVDPLGVWWGLRLQSDGKSRGFDLPIFGGQHGDLPLNESAGKLIGETVSSMRESCIVDLSALQTKEAERRFMLAFLESLYRHAGGDPMHAIFDEADLWAPQNPSKTGAGPQLQSLMEQIVRRGRVRGFIPWLITQRPAVISKDVLSQADGLVAFKLTASQDRKAIGDWVRGQADEGQWPTLDAQLPTMPRGQALVWLPARGVLETADFPAKATFDSSATPKRGEKKQRRELKPLDLESLKGRLSSIEEEAKANDPKALKAEISKLKHDLTRQMRIANEHVNEVERLKKAKAEPKPTPEIAALENRVRELSALLADIAPHLRIAFESIREFSPIAMGKHARANGVVKATPMPKLPRPTRIAGDQQPESGVPSGCAKPLAALAGVYPAGMTEPQWAIAAGYKRSGGTWGAYKSRLLGAALVEKRDGKFFATEAGAAAVGNVETPPPPGADLVRWWAQRLSGTRPMAEALIDAYPNALSKDELGARLGMVTSGGTFGAYLSRLAGAGIVSRDNGIRLVDEVMIG